MGGSIVLISFLRRLGRKLMQSLAFSQVTSLVYSCLGVTDILCNWLEGWRVKTLLLALFKTWSSDSFHKNCLSTQMRIKRSPATEPWVDKFGVVSLMFTHMLIHSVVSNSLQPCRLQPSRFLCPWDIFPGKNTEVGCHFLQGMFPTQGLNLHLLPLLHCRQITFTPEPSGQHRFRDI